MYAGRWITGLSGAKKLELMVSELDKKHIELIAEITGKEWTSFSAWMASQDCLEYFLENPIVLPFGCPKFANSKLIVEKKILNSIAAGFLNEGAAFGGLRIPEVNGFFIDDGLDQHSIKQIESAVCLVQSASKAFEKRWNSLIQMIIPVGFKKADQSLNGRGLSTHFFRKAIFIQLPKASPKLELQLALNLVHELGHQALITYQNADPIIESNRDRPIYSVIRKTDRPAIRSFHAFVVSGYILELLIELKSKTKNTDLYDQVINEIPFYRKLIFQAVKEFRQESIHFTQLGLEILTEIEILASYEGIT